MQGWLNDTAELNRMRLRECQQGSKDPRWAGLSCRGWWGKVDQREVRTLRQEVWKAGRNLLVPFSLLQTFKNPGQVQKYLSFKLKNTFKGGNMMFFGDWLTNKREDKSLTIWPQFSEVYCMPSNSPQASGFGISFWTGRLSSGKEGNLSKRFFAPKEISVGKVQDSNSRACCSWIIKWYPGFWAAEKLTFVFRECWLSLQPWFPRAGNQGWKELEFFPSKLDLCWYPENQK